MTIKQQVLNEITKISEEEPILQGILDIIATHRNSIQRTTKNGRVMRTQCKLESLDCPYPFEADL